MALTINPVKGARSVSGTIREEFLDITLDTAYPTGGYSLAPKDLNLSTDIFGLQVVGGNPAAGAYLASYDTVNKKLMVFYPSGGGVAPAALGDPAITAGATAVTSSAANGSADLTAGRGRELANNTNASTLTFRIRAIGN